MNSSFMPLLFVLFEIYLIVTIFFLLLDNREPAETFAWIFVFILLPGFGGLLYFIVGHNGKRRYNRAKKLPQSITKGLVTMFKPLDAVQEEIIGAVKNRRQVYQDDLMTLLYRNSKALITSNNKVKFFHDGRSKFDELFRDIEKAKCFIH